LANLLRDHLTAHLLRLDRLGALDLLALGGDLDLLLLGEVGAVLDHLAAARDVVVLELLRGVRETRCRPA